MPRPIRVRGRLRPGAVPVTAFASGGPARLARKAVLRSRDDPAEAAVAIVFSVIAADAFLADVVGAAHVIAGYYETQTPDVQAVLDYAAGGGGAQLERFAEVAALLVEPRMLEDEVRSRDLEMLLALRNELTHDGPRRPEHRGSESGSMGRIAEHLRRRGVIQRPKGADRRVLAAADEIAHGEAVALWAYRAARASIGGLFAGAVASPLVVLAHAGLVAWDKSEPCLPELP